LKVVAWPFTEAVNVALVLGALFFLQAVKNKVVTKRTAVDFFIVSYSYKKIIWLDNV
jgi:hypothetical protein